MSEKFLVIDGSSLIHRAFFALPPLTTRQGLQTGAVYGFCNMFLKLMTDIKPKWVVVAFDKSRKTFRTEFYPEYKAQRKPTPSELKEQFPLMRQVLETMGITVLEMDNYEADDIIGTFAKKAPSETDVVIVTGDKDELQLIDDRTKVYYTKRGISDIKIYDAAAFAEDYEGLVPLQLIELKGLMGDSSDNIPGVPGVGPKTALKLICEYGNVETVLENIENVAGKSLKEKLTANKESALLSKRLATIFTDVPVDLDINKYQISGIQTAARGLMQDLEFRNLYERFAYVMGEVQSSNQVATNVDANTNAEEGSLFTQENASAENEPALENGMSSLFAFVEDETEVTVLDSQKSAADAIEKIEKNEDITWFLTTSQGKITDLTFATAQVYFDKIIYDFQGNDAIAEFTKWLTTSETKKGTVASKEVYKTCFAQNLEPKNITEDLTVAAYLDEPGKASYALDKLCEMYLVGSFNIDASSLEKLGRNLKEQLEFKKIEKLYRTLELPLCAVLARMELAGITVDLKALDIKRDLIAKQLVKLEETAKEQAGDPNFNPKSPKQLGVVLFEKLQLPVIKKTKTGYSTDVTVLEELEGKHPLIKTILEHRQLSKLFSTYLEGLKPLIDPETHRIHTHFQQTVTVTGRLSSTDPNLQNIPTRTALGREIRSLFVPGKGYNKLMACDYSQIELRILAHIAKDKLLLESFELGQDVHARTAAEVFGVPLDKVTAEMRSKAKAVNFGIVYGISDFGLAKQIGSTRKEAAQYIENYFERYTGVKKYMEEIVKEARTKGYVTTLMDRRRYLPDIRHSNFNLRSFAERTAINTPIQGTAADIMKVAMLNVDKALREAGVTARVLLQVHDELVLEVTGSACERVGEIVKSEMEKAFALEVPLVADVKVGNSWAETK